MASVHNLLGRKVTFILKDGSEVTYEPERLIAKEVREETSWEDTSGIPTTRWVWHISGLPVPEDDTVYLVSPMVLSVAALMGRTTKDLRSPAGAVPGKPGLYRVLVRL